MLKNIWRYIKKNLRLAVFLSCINLVLFSCLIYFNYNILSYLNDIDRRTSIDNIITQQRISELYETIIDISSLEIIVNTFQSNIIAKTQTKIVEIQKRLEGMKTIDLEDTEKIQKANLIMYNVTKNFAGSGTHIRKNGVDYILTCAHLIKEVEDNFIAIENKTNEQINITLVDFDRGLDLALFKLPRTRKDIPVLEISSEFPKPGSEVILIGNPSMMEDIITEGIIAKIAKRDYIITNKAYFGNSGGALLYKGKIVGVLSALQVFFEFPYMQDYAIAINLKSINRFIEDCEI